MELLKCLKKVMTENADNEPEVCFHHWNEEESNKESNKGTLT